MEALQPKIWFLKAFVNKSYKNYLQVYRQEQAVVTLNIEVG